MINNDLHQFLRDLWNKGVELWLEGDQLRFRGDKKVVSGDTLSRLRANKDELIEIIRKAPQAFTGFPLSHGQRAIHLMQSLAPDSFAYNQVVLLKLNNDLDIQTLETSIDFLLQRHAPLRMSIENLGGHMAQQVSYSLPSILSSEEISITDEEQWQEWISNEADRPFDLSAEPLIRAKLLINTASDSPYHLLIGAHHIIADFWALDLIVKELEKIYLSELNNENVDLPEIGKLYKDYVIHEREWLESDAGKLAREYWIEKLTPLPPTLELPTDFSRPQQQSFQGQEFTFSLGKELTAEIKRQSKAIHVTPFVWVLSCYQVLLHYYSGEEKIAIGSPVACRTQTDFHRLAGHFTNPVILLADFSESNLFKALLYENKEQSLQSLKYQQYPLQCLIEDLHPQRDANTNPLFQVAISWNQLNADLEPSSGLIEDIELMGQRGAIYDLVLSCFDRGDDIQLSWRFNSDIFKKSSIENLTEHLMNLLTTTCKDSNREISQLDILTEAEKQVAAAINKTKTDYPRDKNLATLFRNKAEEFPESIAFKHQDRFWTYRQLETDSNRLANFLVRHGVKSRQHIAICINRSYDLLVSILATLKTGSAFIPINPEYPEDRISYITRETNAPVMLSLSGHAQHLAGVREECKNTQFFYIDDSATEINKEPDNCNIFRNGSIKDNDTACVVFTSGSTGKPKGVQVPHRAISRLTINTNYIHIEPGDKVLHLSNISFDAINIEIWNALLNGGCVICLDNDTILSPDKFAALIDKESPQAAFVTTALFNILVSYRPDIFSSLNYLLFGGEAHDINQILKCIQHGKPKHLLHVYGPTENGSLSTSYEIPDTITKVSDIPIGKPLSNNQAYIVDKNGKQTPFNVIGEIIVGGDGISTGYLNQPQLTAQQFSADYFRKKGKIYATGDLGYMREDGEIIYAGRKDDQVKIRGYRIELGEIEQNISHFNTVDQCYVIVKNNNDMPYLAAYYTASEPVEPSTIKTFLRKQLPEFMIPAALMQLKELPINPNGKIDKSRLPEIHIEHTQEYVAPRNSQEEKIADTWQEILGLDRIGVFENFFELGGHSLLAVKLASALQEKLNIDVPMRMIFEHPNIADLAEIIASTRQTALPSIKPLPDKRDIPASLAQQRLWFLNQLDPRSKAYNMPVALRFSMPVKTALVEKCIKTLIMRHEALQTSFIDKSGVAYLNIESVDDWKLPAIDLSRLSKPAAEEEARNQINILANNIFILDHGPLFKAIMIRLNHNEHILALCLHHIIIDGWSVEQLFSELGILWKHFQKHDNNPLSKLDIQYSDYSQWQRDWMQGDVLDSQLGYWKKQLSGAPSLLNLPTDKPRPAVLTTEGAQYHFNIPETIVDQLRSLGQRNNTTLFMSLLAGFSILLARYSQQSDICIGFPISGRNNKALEPLIGLFVNNLVVRCDLSRDSSIDEYIKQIRRTTIDAYANQDVPFDLIIDALKLERSLSYTPLLQVSFSLEPENLDARIEKSLGKNVKQEPLDWHIAKYDINLTCYESSGDMQATLEYNTNLFEEESIARMGSHYVRLLEQIVSAGSNHINELQMLTQKERVQFVETWHDPQEKNNRPSINAVNRFEIQANTFANRTAVIYEEEQLSYTELNQRVNQLAHYLQNKGIGASDFVGLFIERSLDTVISIIAVLKTGAAYIPLDPNSPAERINFIIEDAEIEHVVTTSDISEYLMVKNTIMLDQEADHIRQCDDSNPGIHIPNDANAYVIYTSGTTGKPKGCLVSHRNLARLFTVTEDTFQFDENDVWTLFHSYAFDFSVWEMWGALLYGGKVVVTPYWITRTPDSFYQLLQDEQVTILNQTPSAFSQLIAIDHVHQKPLELRHIIFGGEALDFSALQQWVEKHPLDKTVLTNMYGITETTVHVTHHRLTEENLNKSRSIIGKPLGDLHIHLLDASGQHVPIGVLGEIYISGAGVTNGYLNRESLTSERFLYNPFARELPSDAATDHEKMYRSGDLARRLNNGDIEYLGRIDHQVKIRGHRIELGEIESVLSTLEHVSESIVIAREDEPGNKRLVAYLLCEEAFGLDTNEIRRHLKLSLPDYMIPTAFITLSEWPLTANGKIDKLQLPAPNLGSVSSKDYVAPRNDTELTICSIWSDILGIEKVGVNDNFFELGGHSLLATQVASRIRSQLDCSLELRSVFENPTVAELAVVILEEEIEALEIDESDLLAMLEELD